MGFLERLERIRKERKPGVGELAKLVNIHSTQLRRYEKGESQPTLDVLRSLAVALNVSGDMLLFDEEERIPPEDFVLQFQALTQLSPEDKKSTRSLVDGLILRHQAKNLIDGLQTG